MEESGLNILAKKLSASGVGGLSLGACHNASHFYEVGQYRDIASLPNNILLEIFSFYRQTSKELGDSPWKWKTLVHVCQRWRHIVYASPRRLDLWLLCKHGTPVRRILDCWPSLPIVIKYWASLEFRPPSLEDEEDVLAALGHPNRVRGVQIAITSSLWEKVASQMHVPFPELTSLSLWSDTRTVPVLPNTFLGGSAPCLKHLSLIGIPFPDLPKLLLSTSDLSSLQLLEVPDAGYIPPDVMTSRLSALTDLRMLCIEFHSPTSHRDNGRWPRPPPNRITLPNLTCFNFRGVSEYLEDLVLRIDTPSLNHVNITFFNQLIFHVPHLSQFICRMEILKSAKVAEMESSFGSGVSITLDQPVATRGSVDQSHTENASSDGIDSGAPLRSTQSGYSYGSWSSAAQEGDDATGAFGYVLSLRILCGKLDWQVFSMAQICGQSCLLFGVEHLYIHADYLQHGWQDDMDSAAWLELFYWCTSVKKLSISGDLGPHIAPALEEAAGQTVEEVLPGLSTLRFECSRKSAPVELFVNARQRYGRPVDVRYTPFPSVSDDMGMG